MTKASFATVLKSWSSANNGSNQRLARIASFIVTLVGCLVFIGWSLNIPIFASPIPGAASMKANTALCFILAGISLGLQTRNRQNRRTVRIAKGCAIAVSTIALLTLCQYLFSWNLGIDRLLFQDPLTPATSYPGRMGENTALNFVLMGLALWLRGQKTRRSDFVAQSATLCAAAIALLAVVGYAYNVKVFHQFIFYSSSMAFHTALTFLVLCGGILASRTDYGLWKIFTGELAGSIVARRLILIAIVVPLGLGWLILHGLTLQLYDTAFCLALLVVLLVLTFTIVILKNAQDLNRIDYDRRRSDERLRSSEERLRMALQGAAQGIWDWDLRTQTLTWDDRCKAIFGLPPDFSITYEWHLNALHPEDRQRVVDAATVALRDRTKFNEEYRTFHSDGTMVWVLARGQGYYDATGEAYRMSGTVLDISDRKQAEIEIQRLNQELDLRVNELQTILDVVPVGIAIAEDPACQSICANGFAQSMLAVPPDTNISAIGVQAEILLFKQLRNGQEIAGEDLPMQQAASKGCEVRDVEIQMVRADGATFDWLVNAVPLLNEEGAVRGCIAAFMDMTALKRVQLNEQFLAGLDRQLRQLSDADAMQWETVRSLGEYLNVDRCLWHEIDWENRSTTVERTWYRKDVPNVTGTYALEEYFTPKQLSDFAAGQTMVVCDVTTHPETAPHAQNYLPLGAAAFISVPCIHRGSWVAVLAVNTKTERNWRSDEVALLQEVVRRLWAIIEQTRAIQALRESEERLRLALQAAKQGLYDLNVQTGETIVSLEYAQMLGYDLETLQETNAKWRERLHPDDWEPVSRAYEEYIAGDRSEYRVEFRQRTRSGEWKWILSLGKIVAWDAEGHPLRMLGTHTDISDRKRAEMALEKRNQELDAFVYIVSHDLKAPLRAISNLSQWIEEDLEGILLADSQQQIALLRSRVQRMEAMIDGLLDYARIGRTDGMTEPISVEELLGEVIDSLNPPPSFSITISPDLPTLNTKRLLLSQVFANLIGNSIKHHDRPDGSIRISGQDRGNFYEFVIADDGPGIAPEYHEKIFMIFQSGEPTSRQDSTGIGLSIVKKIVESEKGMIRLESELGKGTTFYVTWPKKEE